MDEFALIEKFFRPLARRAKGALRLQNDTAYFTPGKGERLVLTTDTMIAGVHFFPSENPKTVGQRLLRVSLSDLAASGATPKGYLLNLTGGSIAPSWLKRFVAGLAADQRRFGLALYGGDTTSGAKTLTLSLTAFGTCPIGKSLTRGGAKAGELVCVSGTIGDGYLGLQAAKRGRKTKSLRHYLLPEPRLALGRALRGVASAAIDVSDGLLADIGHILKTSRLGADVSLARIPFSREGRAFAGESVKRKLTLATGGDDYELAFTIPKRNLRRLGFIAKRLRLPLAVIGVTRAGKGFRLLDGKGRPVRFKTGGYRHFR